MSVLAIGADAALLKQFLRFAAVGVLGFLVNVGSVYALKGGLGLYAAGAAAFVAAASVTWFLNRSWTFRDHAQHAPRDRAPGAAARQWVLYVGVTLLGFACYYATYASLIALVPLCRVFPVLPVAAGSVAGLFSNFTLSRSVVFRARPKRRRWRS